MTDLPTHLADAEARLEAARKTAGAAVLEGRDIDHMAMMAIEAEIEGIHAAGGEIARREREARATAERNRIAGLREKLDRLNIERIEVASKANKAASELCEYIKPWLVMNADCARLVRTLNGKGGAGILDKPDSEIRISRMLACTLKPLTGLGRKFGLMTFQGVPLDTVSWADTEQATTSPEILAVLKGADK
ncbi:hypothetical protein [Mesorhizobium sp. M8A.F.Ca.ET.165.01.1.1]|uniref:hypothetical protein n=1 Tax=Mesorhizobium sp. M8A.F.Ca.ET.165.01.1.1 TaxID=2563960 RepID=UPI00109350D7|nr:hypothetical protein [Mesorhizobium sp. M8A.F.Ca.ET.165.01.1.1]TGT35692.1 hypothetical protein EN808_31910 [Mesorhizobium sp. M8A.F.Ca.ET.165.01.1.1]